MSEHLKTKQGSKLTPNPAKTTHENPSAAQFEAPTEGEDPMQSSNDLNGMNYEQAQQLCQEKMREYELEIQDKDPEEREGLLEEARAQCEKFLADFANEMGFDDQIPAGITEDQLTPQQLLYLMQ